MCHSHICICCCWTVHLLSRSSPNWWQTACWGNLSQTYVDSFFQIILDNFHVIPSTARFLYPLKLRRGVLFLCFSCVTGPSWAAKSLTTFRWSWWHFPSGPHWRFNRLDLNYHWATSIFIYDLCLFFVLVQLQPLILAMLLLFQWQENLSNKKNFWELCGSIPLLNTWLRFDVLHLFLAIQPTLSLRA